MRLLSKHHVSKNLRPCRYHFNALQWCDCVLTKQKQVGGYMIIDTFCMLEINIRHFDKAFV